MTKPENPSEPFKRAVTAAVRALSGEPEMEVTYSAEPPALRGLKARLPLPSRNLPPGEVRHRCVARAMPMPCARRITRTRSTTSSARNRRTPPAAFESAEQARVEAIGSLAMQGVANNLAAGLEQRLVNRGLVKARVKADVPIADVLSLMVREKLTGEAPPDSVKHAVDLWRPFIEQNAGKELDKLGDALRDQTAFARLTRTIMRDLSCRTNSMPTKPPTTPAKARIPKARSRKARNRIPRRNRKPPKPTCRRPRRGKRREAPRKCARRCRTRCPTPRSRKKA